MDAAEVRSCIRQQLAGDLMLGVRSAPLRLDPRQRAASAAPAQDKVSRLRVLDEKHVRGCTRCGLSKTRTQTVFGQGSPDARVVFVGEAPGFEEDRQGLAFVGRAGELLTKMIVAMQLSRDEVFICNVVKCRPPNNRDPAAEEVLACSPYLREQLDTISPEVIVALGAPAAKTLLGSAQGIGQLRGRFHNYFLSGTPGVGTSVPLMPTYHPAYLLRTPSDKRKTWADLQMVMELLGLAVPAKK
jgi:DNA polymerase